MKLNKHGWGLREMLVLSGIIILFLLIAIYFIYVFYYGFNKEYRASYYQELENNLQDQAEVYLNEYYENNLTSEKLTITKDVLESNHLNINLVDKNDHACSGYALAYKTHGKISIEPYIKCPKYETTGYEDWRE